MFMFGIIVRVRFELGLVLRLKSGFWLKVGSVSQHYEKTKVT